MAGNGKKSPQSPYLPQLARVILIKLAVQRREILPQKLTSEVIQTISLKALKPKEVTSPVRIRGVISVDGKWHNEGDKEPAVSFEGQYEARYIFPPDIEFALVDKWMEEPFFRDAALAQAIPVVNLHMYTQLEMMGLNTHSKKIGYESKPDSTWKQGNKPPSTETKRVKKRIATIK
jgi:hypothetical protein